MLDKINEMKNNLTDVSGQVDAVKAKGTALIEKLKLFGLGVGAIILMGFLAQMMFPWWTIAIVAFYVGFWINETPAASMAYGTVAVTFLWTAYAGWQSSANGGIVSTSLSDIFNGAVSGTQLIFATGLIGGLVGGFATMAGTLFRDLFKKEVVA